MTIEPRAERYTVQCPVSYRPHGGNLWLHGQLQNMSDTGLLFDAEEGTAPVGTMLEIVVTLPSPAASLINCTAVTVREEIGVPRMAVRIIDARMEVAV